jgi:hypothetical protein
MVSLVLNGGLKWLMTHGAVVGVLPGVLLGLEVTLLLLLRPKVGLVTTNLLREKKKDLQD